MSRSCLAFVLLIAAACGTSDTGGNPSATAVPVGNDGSTADVSTGVSTAMFVFAGSYLDWRKEPAVHESTGPHGDVRVYYNDKYADAFDAGTFPMPVGAMAVKELYDGSDLDGYAASIKIAEGAGKDTWTWYEVIGKSDDPADYDFFGVAHPTCEGCHSGSSKDYSLAPSVPGR